MGSIGIRSVPHHRFRVARLTRLRHDGLMQDLAGPLFITIFALSQAARDVWFSDTFQAYGFFFVVANVFALSSVLFIALALWRVPGELRTIWRHVRLVLWMNLTTALAWSCYFFAIKTVEPAVANTIHSALGPFTAMLVAGRLGAGGGKRICALEKAGYAAIVVAVVALIALTLGGGSGLGVADTGAAKGLALLFVSGPMITISLVLSKRLHDHGFGSISVTAVRYIALVAVAAGLTLALGQGRAVSAGDMALLSGAGLVLVVLPTFVLQLGIARTPAVTAQVIRALGPVFVFAFEPFSARLVWSAPVLAAIVLYSAGTLAANLGRGWRGK